MHALKVDSARKLLLTAAALLLAACNGDSTVAHIAVRVQITPSTDTLAIGDVATPFTAVAFNANDEPIADATIVWRSDQPFLVAVDSTTGTLTALAPGVAAVTAHAGAVADTAQVFVSSPFRLLLDTILLAPGDTFTVPVAAPSGVAPVFSGGASGIATVSASGLVTALGAGVAPVTARADSYTVRGGVQVVVLPDTTGGFVYVAMRGAVERHLRLGGRSFNHPTTNAGTVLNLNALSTAGTEQLAAVLLGGGVSAPGTTTLGTLPATVLADPTADPVCLPPASWLFYADRRHTSPLFSLSTVPADSSTSGSVTITSYGTLQNDHVISGRFTATLQRADLPDSTGQVEAIGTFVLPLLTLSSCPTGS